MQPTYTNPCGSEAGLYTVVLDGVGHLDNTTNYVARKAIYICLSKPSMRVHPRKSPLENDTTPRLRWSPVDEASPVGFASHSQPRGGDML